LGIKGGVCVKKNSRGGSALRRAGRARNCRAKVSEKKGVSSNQADKVGTATEVGSTYFVLKRSQ